jgi:nucleoredoxin
MKIFGPNLPRLLAVLLAFVGAVRAAGWPETLTVKEATNFEIVRAGKVTGTVALAAGTALAVVAAPEGEWVRVRLRNLEGRVRMAHTNLGQAVIPAAAVPPVAAWATPAVEEPVMPPEPEHVPATKMERWLAGKMERWLAGKLVRREQAGMQPVTPARLAGVKFYAIYFSASWCPPCREFTPGLVDAYGKIRSMYPEFEIVLVSRDESERAMVAYMSHDKMEWPAVRWAESKSLREINRFAGDGIPCLVLVDAAGKVLSDSYRWGRYVGPDAVLEDTWKILRDYRKKNPPVRR